MSYFYLAIASTARGCRKVFEKLLTLALLRVRHVPLVTFVARFYQAQVTEKSYGAICGAGREAAG
jgi:hypothetical protein